MTDNEGNADAEVLEGAEGFDATPWTGIEECRVYPHKITMIEQVEREGYVGENHCKAKVFRRAVHGTVVLFAHRLPWWRDMFR